MRFFSFTQNTKESSKESPKTSVDHIVKSYGDLLFDLCESILANSQTAHIVFLAILKKTRTSAQSSRYSEYERSWVLKIACNQLLKFYESYGPRISLQEQIKLNDHTNVSSKLKQFTSYFRRLNSQDQILLLLRDKYDIPYDDISSALAIPEGSLKIRRQQALRTLEEWIWNSS